MTMLSEMELPATKRITMSLFVINGIITVTGLTDIVLGSLVTQDYMRNMLDGTWRWQDLPPLWLLGLPSLSAGALGLLLFLTRSKLWVLIWILFVLASNVGLFAYIYVTDHMNPDLYGVSLNIFGQCYPGKGATCQCTWADGGFSGVLHSPCRHAWRTTVLYLVLVASFTLALSMEMVAVTLQLAYIVWLPRCLQANKARDDKELYKIDTSFAYTSYYAAEATSIKENMITYSTNHTPLLPRIPEVSPDNELQVQTRTDSLVDLKNVTNPNVL